MKGVVIMKEFNTQKKLNRNTVKAILISIFPATIICILMLILSLSILKMSLEKSIMNDLTSSAYLYSKIGIANSNRENQDNRIEYDLKQNTGFDFAWFNCNMKKNSSLNDFRIGKTDIPKVFEKVCNNTKLYTSKNFNISDENYMCVFVPIVHYNEGVVAMAFAGITREAFNNQLKVGRLSMIIAILVLYIICCIPHFRTELKK